MELEYNNSFKAFCLTVLMFNFLSLGNLKSIGKTYRISSESDEDDSKSDEYDPYYAIDFDQLLSSLKHIKSDENNNNKESHPIDISYLFDINSNNKHRYNSEENDVNDKTLFDNIHKFWDHNIFNRTPTQTHSVDFNSLNFDSSEHISTDGTQLTIDEDDIPRRRFDPWSIAWYIGSFGGLIIFFLVVSCSEWCCRRASIDHPSNLRSRYSPEQIQEQQSVSPQTPPPSYHLFAPPPYDSLSEKLKEVPELSRSQLFVVAPVHQNLLKSDQPKEAENETNASSIIQR